MQLFEQLHSQLRGLQEGPGLDSWKLHTGGRGGLVCVSLGLDSSFLIPFTRNSSWTSPGAIHVTPKADTDFK